MKKVKILTIILVIALVSMIAFFGIYIHVQNRMENQVKDYSYAMDLKGARQIILKPDTGTTSVVKDADGKEVSNSSSLTDAEIQEKGYTKEDVNNNEEDALNSENYKKSKDVIEKRLKELDVENYNISLDADNGNIVLEVTENDNTDSIVSNAFETGKFKIIDSDTQEVLMDNSDIKLVNVKYGSNSSSTTSSGTSVYLNIEFNKGGANKLKDITSTYTNTTSNDTTADTNTSEDNTSSEEATTDSTTEKKITMKIDNEEIMSTSFDNIIENGTIQLSIGSASTDTKTIQGYATQANNIATMLDTGNLPVKYSVEENKYLLSDITNNELQTVKYIAIAVIAVALVVLIFKFKLNGILTAISYIGFMAIFVLTIRYTNVIVSIEGILGLLIVAILNYIITYKLLDSVKSEMDQDIIKNKINNVYKEFFIKIIPICISVITFSFIKWIPISSFGMIMFWGIVLMAVYNYIITNNILKIKTK